MLTLPEFLNLCHESSGGGVFLFLFWTLATIGLMLAVFRSSAAQYVRGLLGSRARGVDVPGRRADIMAGRRRLEGMRRALLAPSPDGQPGTPEYLAAAQVEISAAEVALQAEVQAFVALIRPPAWKRLVAKLLDCAFCQCFWSAVILMLISRTDWPVGACLCSALAYAAFAVILYAWLLAPASGSASGSAPGSAPGGQPGGGHAGGGCKGCGGGTPPVTAPPGVSPPGGNARTISRVKGGRDREGAANP